MKTTRRGFIKTSGAVVLALGAVGPFGLVSGQGALDKGLHTIPKESLADPVSYLTRSHFEPFLNTAMHGATTEVAGALTLVEIPDQTRAANQKKGYYGESFILIFEPQSGKRAVAGRYSFDHGSLGKFSLDLLPLGQDGRLQAVINRIAK